MKVIVLEGRSIDFNGRLYLPGESLDLPEKEAKRLIGKTAVSADIGNGIIIKTGALDDITVKELKALLDKLDVAYNAKDTKNKLISLVEANTAEPLAEE